MKLKSFGCSFIHGSELPDCEDRSLTSPSKKTWPALLAAHHSMQYKSFACPGVGNLYIAEQILNECAASKLAVFVINWTFVDRFDYIDSNKLWSAIRPGSDDPIDKLYYQRYHSEYRDKLTTLSMMKLCVDTMLQNKIPFVMTYIDDLIFDSRWHASHAVTLLQNYLKPHCATFDNKNFIQYARDLGHKITDGGHLLESGHQACFEYAKTNFLKDLK